jgi:glycosyltransferase A (GT-A) superfamily protein (DUF2064 family)
MLREKNALFMFCKPPVPGQVKTRLTIERGGKLTPEQAAEFFRRSLLDVAELALIAIEKLEERNAAERRAAVDQQVAAADNQAVAAAADAVPLRSYDFFVSTTPSGAIEQLRAVFEADGEWPRPIEFICDRGASFDEHFDDAFNQLFARGYSKVVSIGGDMPTLSCRHIVEAFMWLDYLAKADEAGLGRGFVCAPCQQSGVSLVGYTATTPLSAQGVYYNTDGLPALDAYTQKLEQTAVPAAYLNPVSDVDGDADLAHAISCLNAIAEATRYQDDLFLARRVLEWIDQRALRASAPPNDEHDPRQYIDTITQ